MILTSQGGLGMPLVRFLGDLGMLLVHCWGDLDMPLVHVWGWSSLFWGGPAMPLAHFVWLVLCWGCDGLGVPMVNSASGFLGCRGSSLLPVD